MKKYVLVATGLLLLTAACKKKSDLEVAASDGKAKLEFSSREIFAESNQEMTVSGKDFAAGTIPADSIMIGQQKTSHPAVEIKADGIFPQTTIKLAEAAPLGDQDLKIGSIQFAKAIKVTPIQLEYMMWGLPSELETVKKYIDDFEKKFPNIHVKILHVPQMYDDKLKTLFAAKTPPDVMYMGLENFPSFVTRGVFLNLDPYITRDNKEFQKEDFYPNLMSIFKHNGQLYGIPKDFTPLALYYNKDLFDKAKLKYPNENWTWDDFLNACHKLTIDVDKDGKPDQYGFVLETWFGQWLPWIWQNGGEIMDKTDTKWLLGDPAYIQKNAEALQFFADLIWKEKVAPTPAVTGDLGSKDMFMTGKVAMCTYGRWMCMDFKDIKGFKWDVSILPKKARRASTLFTVCYAIAAQTKHPEASWQLVKFLTSKEGQTSVADSGLAIPARKSVATTKSFLEAKVLPKINAEAYLKQVEYSAPAPINPHWVEINERLGREFELVFLNKEGSGSEGKPLTALQAIKNVQPDIEKLMAAPVDADMAKK